MYNAIRKLGERHRKGLEPLTSDFHDRCSIVVNLVRTREIGFAGKSKVNNAQSGYVLIESADEFNQLSLVK